MSVSRGRAVHYTCLPIPRYDAYNETFVDDDGVSPLRLARTPPRWENRHPRTPTRWEDIARQAASSRRSIAFGEDPPILAPMIAQVARARSLRSVRTPSIHSPRQQTPAATAVIAPVQRSGSNQSTPTKRDAAPLLEPWPAKAEPAVHLPTETLCFLGFLMLASGVASTLLSFYLLSVAGKRYFLNFSAVGGFTALIVGVLSFRTNKWQWLPHRNYITGYTLLCMTSVLLAGCLGGLVYAVDSENSIAVDVLGGCVCGLSVLGIAGCVLGLVTSACCHRPPPDNRVAHSVSGFFI